MINQIKRIWAAACVGTLCLMGCSGTSKESNSDTIVDFKYEEGPPLSFKEWHCYDIDENRICIPTSWKKQQQSKFLFFSSLDTTDSNSYFVVLKYNKTTSGLSTDKYVRETYSQLKNDSVELFTGYTLKKIFFEDKESVYGEYYTDIKKKPYMTYSTVFEKDNSLFEIALKVDSAKAINYKNTYRDVLFNFQYKQKPIFSAKDEVKNIQVIDLSSR